MGKKDDIKIDAAPTVPKDTGYFLNATHIDQSLLGPDDRSRVIAPGALVHFSQAQTAGLLEKAIGMFIKFKNVEVIKADSESHKKVVVGGPYNNVKGSYTPIV